MTLYELHDLCCNANDQTLYLVYRGTMKDDNLCYYGRSRELHAAGVMGENVVNFTVDPVNRIRVLLADE